MNLLKPTIFISLFNFLLTLALPAGAETSKACGEAKVVSGDSCSNIKVSFDFSGCAGKPASGHSPKISCSKNTVNAKYSSGNYKYQASFEKVLDGWGVVTWKSVRALTETEVQKKREVTAQTPTANPVQTPKTQARELAEAKPEPVKESAPAAAPASAPASTVAPVAASANPFKYGGFFDFRYSAFTAPFDPNVVAANSEAGFGLEDGAFYLNYEKDKVAVVVDIAFRRSKDVDINSSATKPNQSSNNNFAIGVDKSQLYLKYKLTGTWTADLGQFDTPFGVEVNDSKDRYFGKTGLLYDYFLPLTHTGLMLERNSGSWSFKGFAADPNNKGSNGTSTSGDDKTEYGALAAYTTEVFSAQVGFEARPIAKADNTGYGSRNFVDAVTGLNLGPWSFNFEYSLISDPNKNIVTPNDATDWEAPAQGFLGFVNRKLSDNLQLGLRYEHIEKIVVGSVNVSAGEDTTFGVHYKIDPQIELRAEYGNYKFLTTTSTVFSESRWNIASVFQF